MALCWKKKSDSYAQGKWLVSGDTIVGEAGCAVLVMKGDAPAYDWHLILPGRTYHGQRPTQELAQAACEASFYEWLKAASLFEVTE